MSSLYELTGNLIPLRAALDACEVDEDGVSAAPPDLLALLDGLEGEYSAKLDACARVVRSLEAEADAVAQEADRLDRRARALIANAERLKEAMRRSLVATGTASVRTTLFTIGLRKGSERVEVTDVGALPAAFVRVPEPPAPAPDKRAIGEALRAGRDVPGASLVRGESTLSIK